MHGPHGPAARRLGPYRPSWPRSRLPSLAWTPSSGSGSDLRSRPARPLRRVSAARLPQATAARVRRQADHRQADQGRLPRTKDLSRAPARALKGQQGASGSALGPPPHQVAGRPGTQGPAQGALGAGHPARSTASPAGGDLTGTYPDPTVAPGAVAATELGVRPRRADRRLGRRRFRTPPSPRVNWGIRPAVRDGRHDVRPGRGDEARRAGEGPLPGPRLHRVQRQGDRRAGRSRSPSTAPTATRPASTGRIPPAPPSRPS